MVIGIDWDCRWGFDHCIHTDEYDACENHDDPCFCCPENQLRTEALNTSEWLGKKPPNKTLATGEKQ